MFHVHGKPKGKPNMNETERDNATSLPDFRTVVKTDASFRKECGIFSALCASARKAVRSAEGLSGSLLNSLVFEARNGAASIPGPETLGGLAKRGLVRRGLCNGDVRGVVSGLFGFAAAGGVLDEKEFAAREAAFEAAAGGPAPAVFRRLVAAAFPAQTVPVLSATVLAALHRALAAAGRAKPLPADASWLALGSAVHDALRAEWTWPDAPTRGAYAKWLVAWLARKEADGRTPAVRSADPQNRAVARSA